MKSRCPNVFSFVADAVYTAWGSWQPCETCGLTNRRRRSRDCVDPGMLYTAMGACAWRDKNELEHCYRPCGGLNCYWTNCKQFLEFTGCSRLKCLGAPFGATLQYWTVMFLSGIKLILDGRVNCEISFTILLFETFLFTILCPFSIDTK